MYVGLHGICGDTYIYVYVYISIQYSIGTLSSEWKLNSWSPGFLRPEIGSEDWY